MTHSPFNFATYPCCGVELGGKRKVERQPAYPALKQASRNPPLSEGRLASRTPAKVFDDAPFALSRATPFSLCLFFFLYLSSSISLAPYIHHTRTVHAAHFQPVNVRSASRPSTRCTCSATSLFLHCSILDSLILYLFLRLSLPRFLSLLL